MEYFVPKESIVRTIWGKADTVMFVFAGAAAEFALNKAVDWLYFTGRLPADPLGRLFSTVEYARQIVFAERTTAERAIASIGAIHAAVEAKRGAAIPDWAYRDVLYMLIDYSIRAYELLERPLTAGEKEQVFTVFWRVGHGLGIPDLPLCYTDWLPQRQQHLVADLQPSTYTADLYRQYRRHLGPLRYWLLQQVQALVIPGLVRQMLQLGSGEWLRPVLAAYRHGRHLRFSQWARGSLLPAAYQAQIDALNYEPEPGASSNPGAAKAKLFPPYSATTGTGGCPCKAHHSRVSCTPGGSGGRADNPSTHQPASTPKAPPCST